MKLLSVFFLLLVIPSPAQTLLPDQFPEFSTEATIDGVARSGLARITDDQAAGFQEWMRLTTGISSDTQADVVRRLEVSSDLQTWRPALASEIQLETTRSCLTWTLRPGFSSLLSRVRTFPPQ